MERYAYEPLAENEIRLFSLKQGHRPGDLLLTLQHHNLSSSNPRYVALSYCWGDPHDACDVLIQTPSTQTVRPRPTLSITRSLQAALREIGRQVHESLSVWVDQICIDQGNVEERNRQVQRMWQIFSSAEHVYAWLGFDRVISDPILEPYTIRLRAGERGMLASALSRSGWDAFGSRFNLEEELTKQVMTLLDLPYFSRTWIIPEILQARNLTFLYDRRSCSAQELHAALNLMFRTGWKYDVQKLVKIKHVLEGRRQVDRPQANTSSATDHSTFLAALELLHGTKCADIRDRVFAAISSPSLTSRKDMPALRPDYNLSRDELVVTVIAYVDTLQRGLFMNTAELSRTISRSLHVGVSVNLTEAYEARVAASIRSCTRPWSEHESLFLKSGAEIGHPGPFLRHYLAMGTVPLSIETAHRDDDVSSEAAFQSLRPGDSHRLGAET